MNIVIAGGSGFLGTPLVRRLTAAGHDVAVLTRNASSVRVGRAVPWDPAKGEGAWTAEVANADAIVNLAGENLGGGRWTTERKRRIVESRLASTNALVAAMETRREHPRTFVSASAVGYYPTGSDTVYDERARSGDDFLADVTRKWEAAAERAAEVARLVVLRFGVILAADGGALQKMMLPFRFGAGGPVGSGQQWISWIDREDTLRLVEWALANGEVRGIYNATAPEPVRNRDFARALGRAMHRPALLPAPAFALRAALGEMAGMLLEGQRVVPARAMAEGFSFLHPSLESALAGILRSDQGSVIISDR
jgi:uncharacterized protein (TIGR01777 family)